MSKSDYILTPDGELYHYGVKGMKWGVRRSQEELAIGQNYTTPAGGGGGEFEEEPEEELEEKLDVMELAKRADRTIETAKVWVNDKLSMKVIDTISGKAQPLTWQQAKQWVDYTHRYADEYSR